MMISVYCDDATAARLEAIASSTGREVEELAEAAVSEAALAYFTAEADPAKAARS